MGITAQVPEGMRFTNVPQRIGKDVPTKTVQQALTEEELASQKRNLLRKLGVRVIDGVSHLVTKEDTQPTDSPLQEGSPLHTHLEQISPPQTENTLQTLNGTDQYRIVHYANLERKEMGKDDLLRSEEEQVLVKADTFYTSLQKMFQPDAKVYVFHQSRNDEIVQLATLRDAIPLLKGRISHIALDLTDSDLNILKNPSANSGELSPDLRLHPTKLALLKRLVQELQENDLTIIPAALDPEMQDLAIRKADVAHRIQKAAENSEHPVLALLQDTDTQEQTGVASVVAQLKKGRMRTGIQVVQEQVWDPNRYILIDRRGEVHPDDTEKSTDDGKTSLNDLIALMDMGRREGIRIKQRGMRDAQIPDIPQLTEEQKREAIQKGLEAFLQAKHSSDSQEEEDEQVEPSVEELAQKEADTRIVPAPISLEDARRKKEETRIQTQHQRRAA